MLQEREISRAERTVEKYLIRRLRAVRGRGRDLRRFYIEASFFACYGTRDTPDTSHYIHHFSRTVYSSLSFSVGLYSSWARRTYSVGGYALLLCTCFFLRKGNRDTVRVQRSKQIACFNMCHEFMAGEYRATALPVSFFSQCHYSSYLEQRL